MDKLNKDYRIWLASPHMSENKIELSYILEAFEENWIAPFGPNINRFEKGIVNLVTNEEGFSACALSSGTSAIHMALRAIGIHQGDIVICQSFTFSATVNPIIYEGGTPMFIDSSYDDWTIDTNLLERALFDNPGKIKAVIVVHIYGLPCRMDEITRLCKKYGVKLIEDAAESLGALYNNVYTGTIGDYGIFSFNGNKIITSSGGGIIISKDNKSIDKIRFWSTQSRDQALHYQHSELGYNYRMSNIVAGIGLGQLSVLEERVGQKKAIFDYYKEHLGDLPGISFMPVHEWQSPNYWLSCIMTNEQTNYMDIIQALEDVQIQSRPLWKPMHLQPFFHNFPAYTNGVSERLFNNGLCLPSDTKMTHADLAEVCSVLRSVWKI